jgi:hypothetical protein
MKIKNLFCISLLSAIVLIGCSDDEDSSNNYIIPTSVGNYWKYKVALIDTLGDITNYDTTKFEILRDTLINGEKWFWFEREAQGTYLRNFSDGLYGFNRDKRILLIKYPVKKGDTFINSTIDTTFVLEDNILIDVPKGSFNCVEFKSLYKGSDNLLRAITILYMSPGVGNVKEEYYERTKSGRLYKKRISELIDNKVN